MEALLFVMLAISLIILYVSVAVEDETLVVITCIAAVALVTICLCFVVWDALPPEENTEMPQLQEIQPIEMRD